MAAGHRSLGTDDYFSTTSGLFPTVESPFAEAMVKLGRRRDDVVALSADLTKWTDLEPFRDAFPDRFIQVGMAEQNLIGIAGGIAKGGLLPFAVSYGVFATRRAYDQIAMSLATGPSRAVVVGHLPGVTSRFPATHQATEDLALMRALPGTTVIDPADATEVAAAVDAAADHDGLVYMRAQRGKVPRIFDSKDGDGFEIGRARVVRRGDDLAMLATGLATVWALEAAHELAGRGVEASILHVPTLKPADSRAIAEFCSAWPTVSTVENHSIIGGLGELAASVIAREGLGVRLVSQGVEDRWGAYGTVPAVRRAIGLDAESIAKRALEAAEGQR